MSFPLFSVLIANYNNGQYLQQAIDSVLSQSYKNWEIIIVDDKSDDISCDIYSNLVKDSRIHIYYNDENRGCGFTKRACVSYANGELCAFMDPDDALSVDALETMADTFEHYPDAVFAYSRFFECDSTLEKLRISSFQRELPSGISFLEYGKGAISHFYVFRKDSYMKTPGINACGLRSVDHDLYYLMEEVGPGKFVDKPLYYYRTSTGNNISLGNNNSKAFYWDLIAMTDACRRRGLSVESIVFPIIDKVIKNGENAVLNSRTYKLGDRILRPLKHLKKNG